MAVGSVDGNVYVFNAATGDKIESFSTDGSVVAAPMIYYIQDGSPPEWTGYWELAWGSTDGREYAWIPEAPSESAQFQSFDRGPSIRAAPAAPSNTATAGGGGQDSWYITTADGVLQNFGQSTGRPDWTFETDGELRSSPAIRSPYLILGSTNGNVYGINSRLGEQEWMFETGASVESSPSVADGVAYVASNDNRIYAVQIDSGESLWSFETGDAVQSSPAVVDSTVYIGSTDGTVYALEDS